MMRLDAPPSKAQIFRLIALMALVEALSGATQGYINPLLPALGPVFDITDPTISGLFVVSNLAFAVFTPIISRLGDLYGNLRVLRVTTIIVTAGVVLMAVVPTLTTVVLGVTVMACVVGFVPMMTSILRHYSPAHTRLGVSVMVGSLFLSLGLGAMIAGVVGRDNPVTGFWVAVPVAVIAVIATWFLPRGPEPVRGALAWTPMIASALGLIGLVTATSMGPEWGWTDARTIACAIVGLGLITFWVVYDVRAKNPFVRMQMFKVPQVRTISILTFFFGFATIGYLGTNSIFLRSDPVATGYGFAFDPSMLALVYLCLNLIGFLTSLGTSRMLNGLGEKFTLTFSSLLIASCFALLLLFHDRQTVSLVGLGLLGASMGIYQASARSLCVEAVPKEETATAAGINELALSIGIACGAATIKMIASSTTAEASIPLEGFQIMWAILCGIAVISAAISLTYRRSHLDPITGLIRTPQPPLASREVLPRAPRKAGR